jgi:hypothetical protein
MAVLIFMVLTAWCLEASAGAGRELRAAPACATERERRKRMNRKAAITMMRAVAVFLLTAALLFTGPDRAMAALGVDFNKPTADYLVDAPDTAIVGWYFTAGRDLYVTHLGIYDHDIDRRHEEPHQIGLWSVSGTLLRQAAIAEPAGGQHDLYDGKYHFAGITPYRLEAGKTYVVGTTIGPDWFAWFGNAAAAAAHNLTFNPDIAYLYGAYIESSVFVAPELDTVEGIGNFGANLMVTPVPIPAAFWLLGSGLVGLSGLRRRA